LIQSLKLDPQPNKQKRGKGKRVVTHKQSIPANETPVKEEMSDIGVTRTKLDAKIEKFSEEDEEIEEYFDEDYDVKTTVKHKSPETSKKGVAVKRKKKKYVLVSQNPRRNYTRVTNK
jgi:hypothetical protein